MVLRLALLILLLPATLNADGSLNLCLSCHPPHHQQYGTCSDCHRGDPRSSRHEIAHFGLIAGRYAWFMIPGSPQTESGVQLLDRYACRRCHISGSKGNELATNLDDSAIGSSPPLLVEAIRHPVRFMPDFHLPDSLLDALINALYAQALHSEPNAEEVPRIVHFDEGNAAQTDLFTKHCGGCHQLLTTTLGGLGTGVVAPNLSGLLTEFYPQTADNETAWTSDKLEKWLKNPRDIHPLTQMMPVQLKDADVNRLLELLQQPHSSTRH